MDELLEFCARILGDREAAATAADSARAAGDDRLSQLAQAVRELDGVEAAPRAAARTSGAASGGDLASAVAGELAAASEGLSAREHHALALRELLNLSHQEIATVLRLDQAEIAPLIARARLRLRARLRETEVAASTCVEHDRTLSVATMRLDGERVTPADEDWLIDHLGHCVDCSRAHSSMLEGSMCYRGWRVDASSASDGEPAA